LQHFGIELPHQLADVLDLPAPALEVGDAPRLVQGALQALGEVQPLEQVGAQRQQVFTELLQLGAFLLQLGLARLASGLLRAQLLIEFAAFGHEVAFDVVAFFWFAGHAEERGSAAMVCCLAQVS
jgi:hypothetical protein